MMNSLFIVFTSISMCWLLSGSNHSPATNFVLLSHPTKWSFSNKHNKESGGKMAKAGIKGGVKSNRCSKAK